MNFVWKLAAALFGGFLLIMAIGAMQPETERTRANNACYNAEYMAYTAAEKAQAAEICALLRKEADRKMGRLPAGAP